MPRISSELTIVKVNELDPNALDLRVAFGLPCMAEFAALAQEEESAQKAEGEAIQRAYEAFRREVEQELTTKKASRSGVRTP